MIPVRSMKLAYTNEGQNPPGFRLNVTNAFRIKPDIGKTAGWKVGHVETRRRCIDQIVEQYDQARVVTDHHHGIQISGQGFDGGKNRCAAGLINTVDMCDRNIRPMGGGEFMCLTRSRRRRQDDQLRQQVIVFYKTPHPVGIAAPAGRQHAIVIGCDQIGVHGLGMSEKSDTRHQKTRSGFKNVGAKHTRHKPQSAWRKRDDAQTG